MPSVRSGAASNHRNVSASVSELGTYTVLISHFPLAAELAANPPAGHKGHGAALPWP
jgi:hypothetical protein